MDNMPKKVTKKKLASKTKNEEKKQQGIPVGSSSSPKETDEEHLNNHDPNQSLSSFAEGWHEAAGIELSLASPHARNASQEGQVQQTSQFMDPSESVNQRSNANHLWLESNTNQVNWSLENEVPSPQWPGGTQTFSSLIRGSNSSRERSTSPPAFLQRNILQEDHTESASIKRQRNTVYQAQASQGEIAGTLFTHNPRFIANSLYDPTYEEFGLPVDPILRAFVLSGQADQKGKPSSVIKRGKSNM
ncbi:hypothetical protein ACH5RR_018722 [Cinchona calisaya]|uniref:Uncharacterized protein n=1 Tax=Cinchona calisaya TaxID=153742 RepID=A0ABD2ZMR6_9GENT